MSIREHKVMRSLLSCKFLCKEGQDGDSQSNG